MKTQEFYKIYYNFLSAIELLNVKKISNVNNFKFLFPENFSKLSLAFFSAINEVVTDSNLLVDNVPESNFDYRALNLEQVFNHVDLKKLFDKLDVKKIVYLNCLFNSFSIFKDDIQHQFSDILNYLLKLKLPNLSEIDYQLLRLEALTEMNQQLNLGVKLPSEKQIVQALEACDIEIEEKKHAIEKLQKEAQEINQIQKKADAILDAQYQFLEDIATLYLVGGKKFQNGKFNAYPNLKSHDLDQFSCLFGDLFIINQKGASRDFHFGLLQINPKYKNSDFDFESIIQAIFTNAVNYRNRFTSRQVGNEAKIICVSHAALNS